MFILDENKLILVKNGVLKYLEVALKSDDIKIQLQAVGCLKNLSLIGFPGI